MTNDSDWFLDDDALRGELRRAVGPPVIDGYTRLREIDRGAQGDIYEAIQDGTRRKVAIKVLMRSSPRGLREIELAARVTHPNIVRIYESGKTADGRLYLVMEYIDGVPLDRFIRPRRERHRTGGNSRVLSNRTVKPTDGIGATRSMPLDQALRLCAKICAAVDCAHHHGVVHRDLKPSNILIDGEGKPHILDFGVALAVGVDGMTAGTRTTRDGQFVGTLAYASPEQVTSGSHRIDRRSDVYSLGVILYQALTGRLPVQAGGSLTDVIRTITDDEPTPPSVWLRHRHGRLVCAELDAIVLQALAKERDRRYQTAGEVAADIERHLAGKPIAAKRDSAAYGLIKAMRRYRMALRVTAAFAFVVTVSAAALAILYHQAEFERDHAVVARRDAEVAREDARQREQTARRNLYASEMNLAQQAWRDGHTSRMLDLLMQHWPKPGEPDLRGFEWYWLWRQSHRNRVTLRGHTGAVIALVPFPDGRTLATTGSDRVVRLWDATTGRETGMLKGHAYAIAALAISPDGTMLASGGGYGWTHREIVLWNLTTGEQISTLRGEGGAINALTFAPDGRTLATASQDFTAMLWALNPLRPMYEFRGHRAQLTSIAFSPDGKSLVTGCEDWTARLWDVPGGRERAVFREHNEVVSSVRFSPDGKTLATAEWGLHEPGKVYLWDVFTARKKTTLEGHVKGIACVAFSPEGTVLATGGVDGTAKLWDPSTGIERSTIRAHSDAVRCIAFSPDGSTLITGGQDRTVKLWELTAGEPWTTLDSQADWSRCLAFSPDDRTLAVGGGRRHGVMELWDADTGQNLVSHVGEYSPVKATAFSPDGRRLAFVLGNRWTPGDVVVWNVADRRKPETVERYTGQFLSVAYRSDGRLLAAEESDHSLTLRDMASGQAVLRVDNLAATGKLAVGSRDGTLLAVASGPDQSANVVHVWEVTTGRRRAVIPGHPDGVTCMAFAPTGDVLAIGMDERVTLWDLTTGDERAALVSGGGSAASLAFSPDGRALAVASYSGSVKLWDVTTGHERATLMQGPLLCRPVAFSADGRALAVGLEGTVRVVRRATTAEVETHPGVARRLHARASRQADYEREDKAEPLYREALAGYRQALGDDHLWTAEAMFEWGSLLAGRADPTGWTEAERLLLHVLDTAEHRLMPRSRLRRQALEALRRLYGPGAMDKPAQRVGIESRLVGATELQELETGVWNAVTTRDAEPSTYSWAHRQLEEACRDAAYRPMYLITLAIAEYRLGRYQVAAETLNLANEFGSPFNGHWAEPVHQAFSAMVLHQLGRRKEAQSPLRDAKRWIERHPELAHDYQEFVREAEQLIMGPHAGAPMSDPPPRGGRSHR